MKKKLTLALISLLVISTSARADFAFTEQADYTGEAFFSPATQQEKEKNFIEEDKESESRHTIPPIKKLRLSIKDKMQRNAAKKYELAPTAKDVYAGEVGVSEYASKEIEDDFVDMNPDGFEADEEQISENEKSKKHKTKRKAKSKEKVEEAKEEIVLDCETVDYDTDNYTVLAKGDVKVEFVKQGIVVHADTLTFDRINNTIKAEGDVKITKGSQVITGDYIFVDMNEENALIENPITQSATIEIKSRKGYVYADKVVQEDGSISVSDSFPINFHSATRGPKMRTMMFPKNETLSEDMAKGIIKVQVKDIKITQKGDLEIISLTRPKVFKGDKTIFKTKSVKIYTNKKHDYAETNHWEIGSYRGLGLYAGPGYVFELPKGSVLKAMPILNYKSGIGVGALGRFSSGTNQTMAAYGTAASKVIVYGKQRLDDNLYLQYGVNSYMDEWFMGRRRPKYGVGLVYTDGYSSKNFLIKDRTSSFSHRLDAGYYQDLDYDTHFEKLSGNDIGTTRFRYMANARQNLFEYKNKEELKAFSLGVTSQFSAALYGTGDTQVLGRVGPNMHIQYKRWMQDIGYFYSVMDDHTPMPVFDAYRYGQQNLYIREYLRLHRYLTISWFGSITLTGDSPNGRTFQENAFYFSFGPDDVKFNVGYDFIRENLYCSVELMMDAKGTNVEYETLEIKQDKKAKKEEKPVKDTNSQYKAPTQPKVLQRAVVEDVKVMEDVL